MPLHASLFERQGANDGAAATSEVPRWTMEKSMGAMSGYTNKIIVSH
jgi:hypothetical protein